MASYSVEIDFLLKACRLEPDSSIEKHAEALPDDFDWEKLVNTAFRHDVTGLLCHTLLMVSKLIPHEISHAAAQHLKHLRQKNEKTANQLTQILDSLAKKEIKAIPFKGLTLAMSAYGDLRFRSSRDIDFLILRKDVENCIDSMKNFGYVHERNLSPRQWKGFVNYNGQEILYGHGLPVEPHWAFAPRTLSIRLNYSAIWNRTTLTNFNNHSILRLSPEDEFIVLCIHGCKSNWTKLKWVVDIAEFIRSHDSLHWLDIFQLASSQGITRIVKIGILLPVEMVGANIPAQVHDWIRSDAKAVSLVNTLQKNFFIGDDSNLNSRKRGYFHWAMRERISDKLLYLLLTLTQPKVYHFKAVNIPDRLFPLYWPYRYLHDLIALPIWKIIKTLRRQKKS